MPTVKIDNMTVGGTTRPIQTFIASSLKRAEQLLEYLKPLGVDEADVVASRGNEFEVKVSCGNVETLTQATSKTTGVRVVVDKKQSFCTSSDFSDDNLKNLAAKAAEMARHLEPDLITVWLRPSSPSRPRTSFRVV